MKKLITIILAIVCLISLTACLKDNIGSKEIYSSDFRLKAATYEGPILDFITYRDNGTPQTLTEYIFDSSASKYYYFKIDIDENGDFASITSDYTVNGGTAKIVGPRSWGYGADGYYLMAMEYNDNYTLASVGIELENSEDYTKIYYTYNEKGVLISSRRVIVSEGITDELSATYECEYDIYGNPITLFGISEYDKTIYATYSWEPIPNKTSTIGE